MTPCYRILFVISSLLAFNVRPTPDLSRTEPSIDNRATAIRKRGLGLYLPMLYKYPASQALSQPPQAPASTLPEFGSMEESRG
jgi:hypothetical protein